MAQESDQIKNHIDSERRRLEEDLHEIERRVTRAVDWRQRFDQNPLGLLAIAAGGGLLLAFVIGRESPVSFSDLSDEMNFAPGFTGPRQSKPAGKMASLMEPIAETFDNSVAAIVGVGSRAVQDFIGNVIPNFREEYRRVQSNRA